LLVGLGENTLGREDLMVILAFEDWKKKFERMSVDTPPWKALQTLAEHLRSLKDSESGSKPKWLNLLDLGEDRGWSNGATEYALQLIYRLTLPPVHLDERKLKQDAYTRRALDRLTTQAESFIAHLQKTTVMVSTNTKQQYLINLTPLMHAYKRAAEASRYFLSLLERPYARKPDVFDQFLGFVGVADRLKLPELQILELLRFALLTHGYSTDEVDDFIDKEQIRDGKFRRRRAAGERSLVSFFEMVSEKTEEQEESSKQSPTSLPKRKN
jgi:hypothetical protein